MKIAEIGQHYARSGRHTRSTIHPTPAGREIVGWLAPFIGERPVDYQETVARILDSSYDRRGNPVDQ